MPRSDISGFYRLSPEERLKLVKEFAGLDDAEAELLQRSGALSLQQADRMIENVIGVTSFPVGIATNFLINGKDYLIPMVIEEPSVVAAASNAAKMARVRGGFRTESTLPVMIGQIQLVDVEDPMVAKERIIKETSRILAKANEQDPVLVKLGGGAVGLDVRILSSSIGPMVIIHLLVDVRDAMGANVINTMCEAVAPMIEQITGGRVFLRIVSNLAIHRLARARAVFAKEALGGEEVVDGILKAYEFAAADPFRCATHNKGIMNGVIAVALATLNDTRALEAGAHAYAAMGGSYRPLSHWYRTPEGDLAGSIELPVAVGVIGGATAVHPIAKICRKILGMPSARQLGEIMAAVGLANNLAAMRALATEGIQAGHLKLHAKNIAVTAGAEGELIDIVARRMIEEKKVSYDRALAILRELKSQP
ncbi:MAG: hydroxymethylglutaryl-CoA reductase, degradative [Candidatus Hadarchaeum sp.]|uniref:hydroxymethylglutaryl-CoA reductase, degradative n=1 Tax=Candidatus Hadarchaeum sp. TaxID=2883567 RepID=UPI003175EB9A